MTPARIEPHAKTCRNRSPVRLVPSDELLAETGISVRIHVPYDIEMGWTIDSTNAQRRGMNSYNIHAHIYGISRGMIMSLPPTEMA